MGPPTVQDAQRTMLAATSSKLEGLHELPVGVILGFRDKKGSWGDIGAFYAYCYRCGEWLDFAAARRHTRCNGCSWDSALHKVAWDWWPEIEGIGNRVQRGRHPFYEDIYDRRNCAGNDGQWPPLVVGQRQLLRAPPTQGLSLPLEIMVDVPSFEDEVDCEGDVILDPAIGSPLKVVLYFHGHGGEDCGVAPYSFPGCVIIAPQCPRFITQGLRCFWFNEGPGGAWDRHEHEKLKRSEVLLGAVGTAVDAILEGLSKLNYRHGVKRELCVVGVSMGGNAVLEFARTFPDRVHGAAVISGYYNRYEIPELVHAIARIPLLLKHSHEDRACPFHIIEKLHQARISGANGHSAIGKSQRAETVCWFSDGQQHTPTNEELMDAITWVLRL